MALFNLQLLFVLAYLLQAIAFQPARIPDEGAYELQTDDSHDETTDDIHDETWTAKETEDCTDRINSFRCYMNKKAMQLKHKGVTGCESEMMQINCQRTCHICHRKKAPAPPIHADCRDTTFGCCWDGKTTQYNYEGEGCPPCEDEKDYKALCGIWAKYCTTPDNKISYEVVQKYCHQTCNKCFVKTTPKVGLVTSLAPEITNNSYVNSDDVPRRGAIWVWTKFIDFFGFNR